MTAVSWAIAALVLATTLLCVMADAIRDAHVRLNRLERLEATDWCRP